jgi:hypothetical protein
LGKSNSKAGFEEISMRALQNRSQNHFSYFEAKLSGFCEKGPDLSFQPFTVFVVFCFQFRQTSLFYASAKGFVDVCQMLLKSKDIDIGVVNAVTAHFPFMSVMFISIVLFMNSQSDYFVLVVFAFVISMSFS